MAVSVRITGLVVAGFRNLSAVKIQPDPTANVLLGCNGQGKTSVLEAIDYAATLQSFRGASRTQLVGHDVPVAQVLLGVTGKDHAREYRVRLTRTTREVRLDGKCPDRAVEYFGGAACVVFQPGDLELVRGSPDSRRRLLDRVLVRVVEGYGEALKSYARALRSRNQVLRDGTPDVRAVQAYDPALARYGSTIVQTRQSVVEDIVRASRQALDELALRADISVSYRPRGLSDPEAYLRSLASGLATDIARRATVLGPHGDDVILGWGGHPARVVASQGQCRALALALRLAELHVIEARTGAVPVLLLDDVSSELDRERTERLFRLVGSLGAQVWVTTTDPGIAKMVPGARVVQVQAGEALSDLAGNPREW